MFLGGYPYSYKGVLMKINPNAVAGFANRFYGDLSYLQSPDDLRMLYPFGSIRDSLRNRVFSVDDVVNNAGVSYTSNKHIGNAILVLRDTSSGQIIYFKYDSYYEHNFPFVSSSTALDETVLGSSNALPMDETVLGSSNALPIALDETTLCSRIEREVDEFTDKIGLHSPLIGVGYSIAPLRIHKYIAKSNTVYYLSLTAYGATVVVDGTGIIILFTDGSKLIKSDEEIDVDVSDEGYEYSAFITLTQSDLTTLSTKQVKKFRLYIFDEEVESSEAEKFMVYVKCIRKQK